MLFYNYFKMLYCNSPFTVIVILNLKKLVRIDYFDEINFFCFYKLFFFSKLV